MLNPGEKLWNGAIVTVHLATAYNAMTARIEGFEKDGLKVPEQLLNGRHNLIANVAKEA